MRLLIAIVLVVAGIAGGAALGALLRAPDTAPEPDPTPTAKHPPTPGSPLDETAYVKLSRQLIVPVVREGRTIALMLFDVAVDVVPEKRDAAFAREPRLRDAFLRALFELSNTGAFDRDYIDERVLEELRRTLLDRARLHLGMAAREVLILDVLRQEQ